MMLWSNQLTKIFGEWVLILRKINLKKVHNRVDHALNLRNSSSSSLFVQVQVPFICTCNCKSSTLTFSVKLTKCFIIGLIINEVRIIKMRPYKIFMNGNHWLPWKNIVCSLNSLLPLLFVLWYGDWNLPGHQGTFQDALHK